MMVREHIYFSGEVQGVGFRFRASMIANEGEQSVINRFIVRMRNERWIDITNVEMHEMPVDSREKSFNITY